ncbi:hypothetical protein P8605_04480 [Streptomyces sp. T-3]|nr:hypothetical protein [Streptomyces sp. T-3]
MTTPPPQGQNPYGQPQGGNPYGQQAPQGYPQQAPQGYPQQGYPQQPGQPGVPQQPSPYFNQAPPQPAPSRRVSFKTIKTVGMVVAFVILATVGFIASRDDADTAAVGDCMSIGNESSSSNPDLEVVDCGDSKAKYKVAEKKDGSGSCDLTKYSQYRESGSGDSFTLCLEPHKP